MSERRIQFNNIIQNQLPDYVREEFPLISEFLKQYYISQEFAGSATDLLQNIDQYIKLDSIKNKSKNTILVNDISFSDEIITVDSIDGFPNSYGLLKIDNEIITYTEKATNTLEDFGVIYVDSNIVYYDNLSLDYLGREFFFKDAVADEDGKQVQSLIITNITDTYFELSSSPIKSEDVNGYNSNNLYDFYISNPQFKGCVRGFSGITSYKKENNPEELVFDSSISTSHNKNSTVINLSSLFLDEFFSKIKYQLSPGFENRDFYSGVDKYFFLKQSKDFYSTRGTDLSFKILFKVLYGEDVKVIKPQDYIIKPSDAQYNITNDLVVESISGNPYELVNSTLFQDEYFNIPKGYAQISNVEKIFCKDGKEYFKLSFDAGYNRDIRVDGALYGSFSVHTKTKVIGTVVAGSDTINVDSTVGFPLSGELYIKYPDSSEGVITYTSKSINQFFGCNNITNEIPDEYDIWINSYAYGSSNTNFDDTIKVRITSVLKDIDILDDTYYQVSGTKGVIKSLGNDSSTIVSENSIVNISKNIEILSIELLSSDTYELISKLPHKLMVGDDIEIMSSDGTSSISKVSKINSLYSFQISGQGPLSLTNFYIVKRLLKKVVSEKYSYLSNHLSDIQNIYDDSEDASLISSNCLPFYNGVRLDTYNRILDFNGYFEGDIFTFYSIEDHGFYTGDSVYYSPSSNDSILPKGVYFVARVNSNNEISNIGKSNKLKFARSRALLNESFVNQSNENLIYFEYEEISDGKIIDYDFYDQKSKSEKKLESQKILRKISTPINEGKLTPTTSGTIGILINGVEILNYKSKDKIYYGPIESINVVNPGNNYDVINPPELKINDSTGIGATAHCSVKGSLQSIRIIDSGFDYLDTPKINIIGGNGYGAKANPVMKLIDHKVFFNSEEKSAFVNLSNNSIDLTSYHKFRNYERVIYKTENQSPIGGLSSDSEYYVSVETMYSVKLYKTYEDCVSGINTISLTSYGVGNHYLQSYNKKSVIASINIENTGSNYENKLRTCDSSSVNIYSSEININNHDYKTGEIIVYKNNGSVIGGLQNNSSYYVTAVNDNTFKLSLVGIGLDNKDFYFETDQYITFTSSGSGTHTFNYPEISITIDGKLGVSTIFSASIQPIVRGNITSVHLKSGGVGYGCSDIINFKRLPTITIDSGSGASLTPIVNDGKIVEVLVNNPGQGYNSPPNLSIITNGSGKGAVITPIIEDGQIKSVKIIENGIGYDKNSTFISVTSSGLRAEFDISLKSWTINLFQKYFNNIKLDDGIIYYNPNSKYGLQYTHLYAPRKLRENIFPKQDSEKIIFNKNDLTKNNNVEVLSDNKSHSPIIGWAYDGNPIYGPYGYSKKDGGTVTRMLSGYELISSSQNINRPSNQIFPLGFFVEDYVYKNDDNDYVLDKHNGRFCITPDFPEGTYAYFATIENIASGSFGGYILPKFPYLIGNEYKSSPISFNFSRFSNQDDINLNETLWVRNTNLYNIFDDTSSYSYLNFPNDLNQIVDIKYTTSGSIDSVGIITGGNGYKINDKILFDDSDTFGYGFSSRISKIGGRDVNRISVASTVIDNVTIYPRQDSKELFVVESIFPHNFTNNQLISLSGISTTTVDNGKFYTINVIKNNLSISDPSGVPDINTTGVVTYISVYGNLSSEFIKENDIFLLGNEQLKVLNIDQNSSRIRVLRGYNSTLSPSHNYGDILYEIPRRFIIKSNNLKANTYKLNKEIYFNPIESISIGNSEGPGIGYTLSFSNPGVGDTQIFIPTRTIYLPKHNLNTGDSLIYSANGGSSIEVSENGVTSYPLDNNIPVYVAKISNDLIGISTVRIGLGSTGTFVGTASTTLSKGILFFTGVGTNTYHSFKTTYDKITGKAYKNTVTVSTLENHQLSNNDTVYVNVISGISTTLKIKYNDLNRRMTIDEREFTYDDVNIIENSITIKNHSYHTGQKVIHSSDIPSGGLFNDKIYYIVVFDKDTIKLSETYYNSIIDEPIIVDITSTSSGSLSLVNPPLTFYRNSTINFDVSDLSLSYSSGSQRYSAYELNFYVDSNYTHIFESKGTSNKFSISRIGTVGISSNSLVTLKIDDDIPDKLYYKLDKVYDSGSTLPSVKEEIIIDTSVQSNNEIIISNSAYNGEYNIVSTGTSTFSYTVSSELERSEYITPQSNITYETTSLTEIGPITEVKITSKGQNYRSLPDFIQIKSENGSGCILESISNSIGKIKTTKINDIGFDFPSDNTLRPKLSLPQILKVEPLNSFETIEVISFGRGYLTPPKLVVLDGKTKDLIDEVDIRYSLGDKNVEILTNTYRLNDVDPIIIPTQNSNGVGISSIYFNSFTKEVTVNLNVGYSTESSFPFSVGDRVLIENISVGINTTGKGYNSKNYNYELFTITSIDPNIGGENGSVTYNIEKLLQGGEYPGLFDEENSSGRIVPEKYFPTFDYTLRPNNFIKDEKIKYNDSKSIIGSVESWNNKIKYLVVSSRYDMIENKILEGVSSKTQGRISKSISPRSYLELDAYNKIENGWISDTGILNNDLQRMQDNFYYQNFSYSLKSKVSYNTWEDVVGSLNHTAGFKKFSDYQLESYSTAGISTDVKSSIEVVVDIDGFASLNCVYDFDLASENALLIDSNIISDEITFSSRILTDYFESVSNRVLSIDDISQFFNSNPRPTKYSVVYRFPLSDSRSQKHITYVKDRRFVSERQLMILTLLHDNTKGYINQYGRIESYPELGSFDFTIENDEGLILFYPIKYKINDYDVTLITYNLRDNFNGIGTTSISNLVDITTNSVFASSQTTITKLDITKYTSAKILVGIGNDNSQYEFDELNIIHDGTNIEFISYGQLTNHSTDSFSIPGLGEYSAYISGNDLNVDFIPVVGTSVTVSTINVSIANTLTTGIGTINSDYMKFEANSVSIASSSSPSEVAIAQYSNNYDGGYFIIQISDVVNNSYQLSEVVMINDLNNAYLTEYGTLVTNSGLGTFGAQKNIDDISILTFTPIPDIDVEVKVYFNSISSIQTPQ